MQESESGNEQAEKNENNSSDVTVTDEAWGLANGTVFEFNQRPGDCCGRVLGD